MQKQDMPNVALTERQIHEVCMMVNFAKSNTEALSEQQRLRRGFTDWDEESAQAIVDQLLQGLNHSETIFD